MSAPTPRARPIGSRSPWQTAAPPSLTRNWTPGPTSWPTTCARWGCGKAITSPWCWRTGCEFFEVTVAAMRSGLYVTPINWHLAADEAEYIVNDCGASRHHRLGASARADEPARRSPIARPARLVVGGAVDGFEDYDAGAGRAADRRRSRTRARARGCSTRRARPASPRASSPAASAASSALRARSSDAGPGSLRRSARAPSTSRPAPLYHAAPAGLDRWRPAPRAAPPWSWSASIRWRRLRADRALSRHPCAVRADPSHPAAEAARERSGTGSTCRACATSVHAAAPCPPEVKRAAIEWLGPIVYEYYSGSEGAGFCAIGPEEWLAHPGSVGTLAAGRGPHRRRGRRRSLPPMRPGRSGSRRRHASSTTAIRRRPPRRSTTAAGAPSATSAMWTTRATSTSPIASRTW